MTDVTDFVFVATLDDKGIQETLGRIDRRFEALANTSTQDIRRIQNTWRQSFNQVGRASEANRRQVVNGIRDITNEVVNLEDQIKILGDSVTDLGLVEAVQELSAIFTLIRRGNILDQITALGNLRDVLGRISFSGLTAGVGSVLTPTNALITAIGLLTIGLVKLSTQGLAAATRGYIQLARNAFPIAEQFENTQIAFENVFKDIPGAAEAAFQTVRRLSRETGTDVSALANAFIPLIGSVEELENSAIATAGLLRLAEIGGRPQTVADAIRSQAEALSGDLRSLRQNFELTFAETELIEQRFEELGTGGVFAGIIEVLEGRGIDFESFADTLPVLQERVREASRDIQNAFGAPLRAAVTDTFRAINKAIQENEKGFESIAFLAGSVGATIVDIFTNLVIPSLESFDDELVTLTEKFIEINSFLFRVQAQIGLVVEKTVGFLELLDLINPFGSLSESLDGFFTVGEDGVDRFGQAFIKLFALFETFQIQLQRYADFVNGEISVLEFFSDDVPEFGDVFNERLVENSKDYAQAQVEAAKRTAELRAELANILKTGRELRDEDLPGFGAPEVATDEEIKAFEDILLRRLKLEKDFIRDTIDLETDAARDRAKIAQGFIDDQRDLIQDYRDDLVDNQIKLDDKLADIDTKDARKRADLEEDSNEKLLEIEEDFQDRLAALRRRFEFDAQEAIRQNDAIRFLQLRRRLQFELREAQINRDEERRDANDTEEQKTRDLDKERQRQTEDANLADERRLRDAQTNLTRGLRDANEARRRDLRNQQIAEEEKRADLQTSYEQQLADFEAFTNDKNDDVTSQIQTELGIIESENQKIVNTEDAFYKLRTTNFENFINDQARLLQQAKTGFESIEQGLGITSRDRAPISTIRQESDANYAARLRREAVRIFIAQNQQQSPDVLNRRIANVRSSLAQASVEEIIEFIESLGGTPPRRKSIRSGATPTPRALGGSVIGGNTYLVGERGPELLQATNGFIGRISPIADPNNFNIPGSSIAPVSVNNSRNVNVDLSMLDPNTLSPTQIAIITNVVQQVMLQATRGL